MNDRKHMLENGVNFAIVTLCAHLCKNPCCVEKRACVKFTGVYNSVCYASPPPDGSEKKEISTRVKRAPSECESCSPRLSVSECDRCR